MIKVSIAENLEEVEKRISAAAKRSGRKREDITLVAVTKTHPAEMMNEAIKLGVTDIGENKPQEVRDKYDSVLPVKWHLIGHLQTNKVKYVIDKVCLIHSVDSIKLMDEIERQAEKHNLDMDILIQVNISGEKYDNVNMVCLSMGMSGDFETAIECGANMVRVGSAIFGARDYSQNK